MECRQFTRRKQEHDAMELVAAHVRYAEPLLTHILEHLRRQLALIGCNQLRNATLDLYRVPFNPKGNAP